MLLYVLVRLKECFRQTPLPPLPADCMLPELTLFITAYNEEDVVDDKMRNSLSLDYPADKLHILWITDGSFFTSPCSSFLARRRSASYAISTFRSS